MTLPPELVTLATGAIAWTVSRRQRAEMASVQRVEREAVEAKPTEEPISTALSMDDLRLELG